MLQRRSSRSEIKRYRSEASLKSKDQADTIVTVLPDGKAGGKALEALEQATSNVSNIERIPFEQLDFGDLKALDKFYSAPVVVVDVTERQYEACLYYQIGLRLSFGMKHNVVLCVDQETCYNAGRSNSLMAEQMNTTTGVSVIIGKIVYRQAQCRTTEALLLSVCKH